MIGENGATEILTDEKGYAVSIAIPYGTYVVVESKTPHNMKAIKPFEVKIRENHPTEPQSWRVFIDREFTAKLRIVKMDDATKRPVLVPNAEFKIFDCDRNEYVTQITTYPSKIKHTSFFTDEDGDLILPKALKVGNYRIEEVKAPEGYVLNESPVMISVDSDTAFETDGDTYEAVIMVEYTDAAVVGELTVEKKGEILSGFEGGFFADTEEKTFIYKEKSLAGAKFRVYAAEDIFTADHQVDAEGNRLMVYAKDDLVTEITTGEDGKAVVKDLPLGNYRVVEVEAPYGYVLNGSEQTVTFAYVDDKTPVIYENLSFSNERQKLDMSVTKLDAEENTPVSGAAFGLYADEDILNADGSVIIEKGTLLEKAVSDDNGKISFVKDYPFARYAARELEAPKGYVSSEEVIFFDTKYQGQDVMTAVYSSEFKNTPIKAEISKTDITGEKELAGAKLQVLDEEGNVVDSWTSEAGTPHMIERIPTGKYRLCEISAPYGYKLAVSVPFEIKETAEIQKVSMKDEQAVGKIVIEKTNKETGKTIAGVKFEIRDPEGNVVDTLTTDKKGHAESIELPICTYNEDGSYKEDIHYSVVETQAAEGYILDETIHDVVLHYDGEAPDCVVSVLELTNKPSREKLPQTGGSAVPLLYFGVGALALAAGIGMGLRGRKKKNMQ